ncbi:hypothetical protein SOP94_06930 [Peribacillus frigoritolerans]|uniref:hypothetical protein n=1 Tax=Peribacillus frigoritolerans TaxID=450367 RepID=UPI002B242F0C|nr:hypothetical protein [Peribacillus frigoritolerans]MEB2628182.1 hypothetical protein [Peribacillus frigoritolerans]
MFNTENPMELKKYATLLPKNWLAETAERERISEIKLSRLLTLHGSYCFMKPQKIEEICVTPA